MKKPLETKVPETIMYEQARAQTLRQYAKGRVIQTALPVSNGRLYIFTDASAFLAPPVFCTCAIHPATGKEAVGALLRTHRKHLGLTQYQVAKSAGIGERTLRRIEKGQGARRKAYEAILPLFFPGYAVLEVPA